MASRRVLDSSRAALRARACRYTGVGAQTTWNHVSVRATTTSRPTLMSDGLEQGSKQRGNAAEVLGEGALPPEVVGLFGNLRDESLRRLDEFGPIHLFSLCWAYATARLLDDELRLKITEAAVERGRRRDRDATSSQRQVAAPGKDADSYAENVKLNATKWHTEMPSVLAEGPEWIAFYKPPFWQVDVDSKEASKAAASVTPFEDEDAEFDDDTSAEGPLRLHRWIHNAYSHLYPICLDALEAYGLMHRLDAQTSGVLLMAKSYVGAYWIRLQWCSYNVSKEYICLVHGWVDPSTREVHKRIRVDKKKAENSRRTVSTRCSVHDSGKPSYTEVVTLARFTKPNKSNRAGEVDKVVDDLERYSLVALKLHTGRTHQIRVHMQSIGHPLVTDVKYGEERFAGDRQWCARNFLHTFRLAFHDIPDEGPEQRRPEVYCPLPVDLRGALKHLVPADTESAARHTEWLSGEVSDISSFETYSSERSRQDRKGIQDGQVDR